jgi:hypothetical protein
MEKVMIKLHPNYIKKNGKEYAVLPFEEFVQLQEELENYYDLVSLRNATTKEKNSPTVRFEDVKKQFGI